MTGQMEALTGWGRVQPPWPRVAEPGDTDQVATLQKAAPDRGVIARGHGRS